MRAITGLFQRLLFPFAFLCLVFSWPGMLDMFQLPKAAGITAAAAFCLLALFVSRDPVKLPFPALFLAVYYLYVSWRLAFSGNHPSFGYGLVFFSPLLFFIPLLPGFKRAPALLFLNIILSISLIYGLFQFGILKISRPYSFFGNPIFFAEFTCSMLVFAVLLLQSFGGAGRFIGAFNILLAVPVIVACSSRGAFISLLVVMTVFLLCFRTAGFIRGRGKSAAILAFAVIAALFIFSLIPGFAGSLKSAAQRFGSLMSLKSPEISQRLQVSYVACRILAGSPAFGAGPGAVKQLYQLKQAELLKSPSSFEFLNTSYSHNDYIQLAAETGLAGLALFLAFVFSLLLYLGRPLPQPDRDGLALEIAAFCVILFFCCEAFFNFPLFSMPSAGLFFLAAGMAASARGLMQEHGILIRPALLKITALILIAPAAFFLVRSKPGAFAADFYLKAVFEATLPAAEACYKRSLSLEPDNFRALSGYAAFLAGSDRSNEALAAFDRALLFFPNSADLLYNKGAALYNMKRYGEALSCFERSLFYYPHFSQARAGLFAARSAQKGKAVPLSAFTPVEVTYFREMTE